jgi:hypothetical protein
MKTNLREATMTRQIYAIGILSVTALILTIANLMPLPRADAQVSIKDRDLTAVTAKAQTGGDALYILDNRSGLVAVFTFDAGSRSLKPQAVRPVTHAFGR